MKRTSMTWIATIAIASSAFAQSGSRGGGGDVSVINGLLIHAIGVGLPSAWFARLASPR